MESAEHAHRPWTIKNRLILAFGSLSAIVAVVAAFAAIALVHQQREFHKFIKGTNARQVVAAELQSAVDRRAVALRNMVLVDSQEQSRAEANNAKRAHDDVTRLLERLLEMLKSPDVPLVALKLGEEISGIEAKYGPVALDIIALMLKGRRDEAIRNINAECQPLLTTLGHKSQAYRDFTIDRGIAMIEEMDADYSNNLAHLILVSLGAFAVAVLAGILITSSLTKALGAEPDDLSAVALAIAEGDLSSIPGDLSVPESSVMASLGRMQQGLSRIVEEVRQSSDSIAVASREIASGNSDLSIRTERQSSALQEISATVDRLNTTVRANADSARNASILVEGVSGMARRGGDMIDRVFQMMRDIDKSSRHIAEIIATIDGIAFQTNVLALNAAVEAARAGGRGNGFAIVATEVRSLALRSADASKEIRSLIQASVERVHAGNQIVDDTRAVIHQVVQDVQKITEIFAMISSASSEQSRALNGVAQAVEHVQQATQQNAALVEQSAAASENLTHQTRRLNETVHIFRLEQQLLGSS